MSEPIDGMVYDDVLDLCWRQDASASDQLTWSNADAWAEALDFGGHTDWRLAQISNTSPTDTPFDCIGGNEQACIDSGNELGYMFYYNLPGDFPKTGDQGPFTNIQAVYWSGTEVPPPPLLLPLEAWSFNTNFGLQLPSLRASSTTVGRFAPDNVEPCRLAHNRSQRWELGVSVC